MNRIITPPGLNERLFRAVEQEIQPMAEELAATERYLCRFRRIPLPQTTQQRLLQAVTAPPVRPPYRLYRRAAAAAGIAAALLLPALWLLPDSTQQETAANGTPATYAAPAAPLLHPAYSVHDAEDQADYCLLTPIVLVSDNVL